MANKGLKYKVHEFQEKDSGQLNLKKGFQERENSKIIIFRVELPGRK